MNGKELLDNILREIRKAVVGNEEVIKLLLVALLSKGHVLIEGVPGVAKTTIAKAFAGVIGLSFRRIQLTPDLMPADITGSVVYDQKMSDFVFKKGPIFTNVLLADEINRAMPKTQSALLEAMQEGRVTIEGASYELPKPFIVIATMNPVELEGIYPLPEAQLDRFLMKIEIGYLNRDEELTLLRRKDKGDFGEVGTVINKDNIEGLFNIVRKTKVSDEILEYIYEIVSRTRQDERLVLGASPRASEHLLYASKALAFLDGRDYVIPDDVKSVTQNILAHRIKIKAEYEIDGVTPEKVIEEIVAKVEVPK